MGRFIKELFKSSILGQSYIRRRTRNREKYYEKKKIRIWNPDSSIKGDFYPEMKKLWKKWIYNNEYNNSGDFTRFYAFILNINQLLRKEIEGDFAEVGVYKGNSAAVLQYYSVLAHRDLLLYDTFEGFNIDELRNDLGHENDFKDTSFEDVKRFVGDAIYRKGLFPETVTNQDKAKKFAFVSLDCDLYNPMLAGLEFFYPRLSKGGMIFCHDYSSGRWKGAREAIDKFVSEQNVPLVLLPDKSGTAIIVRNIL